MATKIMGPPICWIAVWKWGSLFSLIKSKATEIFFNHGSSLHRLCAIAEGLHRRDPPPHLVSRWKIHNGSNMNYMMVYNMIREQIPQSFDVVKEDDEGFFTASSSSDSESDKEASSEVTLLNSSFDQEIQQSITYLAQGSDSPDSEYMEALNEPPESEKAHQQMEELESKEKQAEKEQEASSPVRRRKFQQKEGLSLLGELESGLSSLNHELDAIFEETRLVGERKLNRTSESEFSNLEKLTKEMDELAKSVDGIEGVVGERQLNSTLKRRLSNLEISTKEEDEPAKSADGVEGAENGSFPVLSKLKGLVAQVNDLKLNVNYLNAQKNDSKEEKAHQSSNGFGLEEMLEDDKAAQIAALTEEKESLNGRVEELEKKLEDRGDEFSEVQKKMSSHILALTRQVNQLQQETDLKRRLDQQIDSQDKEISRLGEEKDNLQAKMLEKEIKLTEKDDGIAVLRRRLKVAENEASAEVFNLSAQISFLEQELTSEKRKSQERLIQLENRNAELMHRLSDQQEILKQQEDIIIKLREESRLVKGRFLQAADRKMDEVAEEFKKNFEDKLRILSRRIRVAEQLQVENKDNWKRTKERCEQEHPALEKRLEDIMNTSKAELWKMSDAVDEMMKEMELVISNFDMKERSFMQRISRVLDDIQLSKNWVKLIVEELKPSKNEQMASPFAPMDDQEIEKMMEEKVKRLEAKVKKERADKLRLMRGMYDLQIKVAELEKVISEKDQGLVRLSEEKVEAIRQLCMWIDYHQGRFDHLKEMVLVKRNKSKG
ncbi:hypothetical protein Cgig2_026967 [Carnegiea gigantea]|uniref:Uncharacterized protein n=1 Tax=Carnegiea gigantea TaxID=171969 RepID=A0A9Q1KYE9_9CARY|nr:hypothetical protein Cgig2_026967 [Carnegiea gigantea]